MTRLKLLFSALLITTATCASAQEGIKYTSPVDFRITMAGNVGEIRANHFHTGIDIKATNGVGSPILAVADGYISRIAISPSGYGKALYMTHADGTVSVYAHLDGFVPQIAQWVKKQQYAKKSFRVDLYPPQDMFVFKSGERIASLGNSGSSGGPHLHFEIRDARSGSPINLISKGIYSVPDRVPPELYKIYYMEADTILGMPQFRIAQTLTVSSEGGVAMLSDSVIKVSRDGYLAYEVIDYKDGRSNTMGVYSIEQKVGGKTNFCFTLDRISFATTRYINTFTEYIINKRARQNVLRAYVSPNNALSVYKGITNRGIISRAALSAQIPVETTITDDAGNQTVVKFYLAANDSLSGYSVAPESPRAVSWSRDYAYNDSTLSVSIPQKSLYESAVLSIAGKDSTNTVTVGNPDIPLQKAITIKIIENVPEKLRNKALLATVDEKGKLSSAGGKWEAGGVKAEVRNFGRFRVAYDTVPPVIAPMPLNGSKLSFKITDDLSGIQSYTVTVDGAWELADYDAKNDIITTTITPSATPAKHSVQVTVSDAKANVRKITKEYTW